MDVVPNKDWVAVEAAAPVLKADVCDGALFALLLGLPNTAWAGVLAAAPALKTDVCDGALVALLLGLNVDAEGDPKVNVVTGF